jgi:glutamyl-tRNA reductase
VHDIDALGRIVAENQKHRISQIEKCERILDEEVAAFETWLGEAKARPLITQMYADARDVRDAELKRLFNKCASLTAEQRREVEQAIDRLVNKFMHPCVSTVRRHSLSGPSVTLADALHLAKVNSH